MTDKQVKTYSTKCEIEYSQEYLKRRDITIIFEDTFIMGKDVNGNPEKYMARERICGFYHGEPDEQSLEDYLAKGCEAIMEDEWLEALTKTHGCTSKNEAEDISQAKFTYSVVVYGGFDETPLIRYQRDYDDKSQATTEYHELEDIFRLEHKIFDNNTEQYISQNECSSMAIIRSGAFDNDRVVYFKSLVDNTNYEDYAEDFNLIVKYFQEYDMMS